MDTKLSVWDYYKPGFIDPLYRPYKRNNICDLKQDEIRQGCYSISPSGVPKEYQTLSPLVRPELTRIGKGLSFQRKHYWNPCPMGWVSYESLTEREKEGVKMDEDSDPRLFCFPVSKESENNFYSKNRKASYYKDMMVQDFVTVPQSPRLKEQRTGPVGFGGLPYGYLTSRPQPYKRLATGDSYLIPLSI